MIELNQMLSLLGYLLSFILNERESHLRVLNEKVIWGDFIIPVTVIITLAAV